MNSSRRLTMSLRAAIFLCLAVMRPGPSRAQIGVETLLSSLTDLTISASCWNTRSGFLRSRGECPLHSGWGVEAIFDLGVFPKPPTPDSVWVLEKREIRYEGGRVDSVQVFTKQPGPGNGASGRGVRMELGLGYGQFTGFASSDPGFEIRGTVRETPTLTLYGTLEPGIKGIHPYVGLRTGVLQLHNVQLLQLDTVDNAPGTPDTVVVYKASSDVFQLGGVIGISGQLKAIPLGAFLELGWHLRKFPSVEWSTNSSGKIVDGLPREFDFSGVTLEFGFQAHIRDRK